MNVNGSEPGSSSSSLTAGQKLQELTAFALFVAASSNFALTWDCYFAVRYPTRQYDELHPRRTSENEVDI